MNEKCIKTFEQIYTYIDKLEKGKFSNGKILSTEPSVQFYATELKNSVDLLKVQLEDKNKSFLKNDFSNHSTTKRFVGTHERYTGEDKDRMHKVAYYLSKFEHHDLFDGQLNQTETFEKAAKILHVKMTTLRNKRDQYDPYFNNNRIGWVQAEKLSDDMLRIKQLYDAKSKEEILKDINTFIK
jgi:hypothetical protein